MLIAIAVFVLLASAATTADTNTQGHPTSAKDWPPYCNTYECAKRARKLREQRLRRCLRHSTMVGASRYGVTDGETTGDHDNKLSGDVFAELDYGTALGGLPSGARIDIYRPGYKPLRIRRADNGAGGADVRGPDGRYYNRAIDLWHTAADKIGLSPRLGVTVVRWSRNRCF